MKEVNQVQHEIGLHCVEMHLIYGEEWQDRETEREKVIPRPYASCEMERALLLSAVGTLVLLPHAVLPLTTKVPNHLVTMDFITQVPSLKKIEFDNLLSR